MTIFEKISSYNIVTNLIPGLLLLEALRACGLPFIDGVASPPAWLVLGYALGAVSARLGSLLVEPVAKLLQRPKSDYGAYIDASKQDPKIEILLETGNSYRSLVGGCVAFFLVLAANKLFVSLALSRSAIVGIAVASIGILFFISYVKQDEYIRKRVGHQADGSS